MKRSTAIALFLIGILCLLGACGVEERVESLSELGAENILGAVNTTESNGDLTPLKAMVRSKILFASMLMLPPLSESKALNDCPTLRETLCDESGRKTLVYNQCHAGSSVLNGSQIFQFSSLEVCEARSGAGVPLNGSVLRTFGGSLAENPTTRTWENHRLTIDTATARGYQKPVSGGTLVEFAQSEGYSLRKVTIHGVHRIKEHLKKERVQWDVSISTQTPVEVEKTGHEKIIKSGSTMIQNNLKEFTAMTTILSPLTFSRACCHPTSGTIESSLSGSRQGSETLTYLAECGKAILKDRDGSEMTIDLKECRESD